MSKELTIVNENPVELKNAGLKAATESIIAIGGEIRANMYKVAAIMNYVAENKLYEEDGFKNVSEWGAKCLGFKKSQTYALCKIGKGYTAENNSESTLTHEPNNDYSVTQVIAMFPLGESDKMNEAIKENDITPDMTVAEIKKKVKEIIQSDESDKKENFESADLVEEKEEVSIKVSYGVYTRIVNANQRFIYRGKYEEYNVESVNDVIERCKLNSPVIYMAAATKWSKEKGSLAAYHMVDGTDGFRNYVECEDGTVVIINWDVIKE